MKKSMKSFKKRLDRAENKFLKSANGLFMEHLKDAKARKVYNAGEVANHSWTFDIVWQVYAKVAKELTITNERVATLEQVVRAYQKKA